MRNSTYPTVFVALTEEGRAKGYPVAMHKPMLSDMRVNPNGTIDVLCENGRFYAANPKDLYVRSKG